MTKDRLQTLRRIEAVQKQITKLAELRLAGQMRTCQTLAEDQERLREYIFEQGPIGRDFAKAVLKSAHGVDRNLAAARLAQTQHQAKVDASKQRERAVGEMAKDAARAARRADEDRELAEILAASFAREAASLP